MSATVEEGVRVENPNPLLSDWNGPFAAPPFSQVRAEHFRPAFDAALEGINRLKKTVPIWKKEFFADGETWVEGEWDENTPRMSPA